MARPRTGDPSPEAFRFQEALDRLGLTPDGYLAPAASALGIDEKTIGRWLAPPHATSHRSIPQWAWRLIWTWQRHPAALDDLIINRRKLETFIQDKAR